MREITAFKTSDGVIFDNEKQAEAHQEDIIGTMLDDLVPYDERGNMTRLDRQNILTKMLSDPALKVKIKCLYQALTHGDDH